MKRHLAKLALILGLTTGNAFSMTTAASAMFPEDDPPWNRGVEAEYCLTLHSPSHHRNVTIFTKYLVTDDEWAMVVTGFSPHWIGSGFYPYAYGARYRQFSNGGQLWTVRGQDVPFVFITDLPAFARLEPTGFSPLFFSKVRASIWDLPESASTAILRAGEPPVMGVTPYTVPFSGVDVQMMADVQSSGRNHFSMLQRIEDGLALPLCQRFTELDRRSGSASSQWLPTSVVITTGNGRFVQWNHGLQYPEDNPPLELSADPEQKAASRLLAPRGVGGRHCQLEWTKDSDPVLPRSIRVVLGKEPTGMFLRSARLLQAKVLPREVVEQRIAAFCSSDCPLPRVRQVALDGTSALWGTDKRSADAAELQALQPLITRLESIAAAPESHGERLMALHELCRVALATDPQPTLPTLSLHLAQYFDQLNECSVPEAMIASAFNLHEMLLEWKRPDVQLTVWRLTAERLEQMEPEQQLRALIGAKQSPFANYLHAVLLVRAVEAARSSNVDPVLLRAGLIRARQRYVTHLSNDHVIQRLPTPYPLPPEFDFIRQFRDVLKILARADDGMLQLVSKDFLRDLQRLR